MKRLTALILAMLLVLSMAACGTQESTNSSSGPIFTPPNQTRPTGSDATKPSETEPSTTPTEPGPTEHVHKYTSELTKEPTCEEPGEAVLTCECGDSYSIETTATGHNYMPEVMKEATCLEPGETAYTCRCGDSYVKETELADHQWSEWEETKKPTMYIIGEAQRSCMVCGETETKELPRHSVEEELATFADLIIDLPSFESVDELYAGVLFRWAFTRVPTISSEWNEETNQVTHVYSVEHIDNFTLRYLNQTFDFVYLANYYDSLTYDEENNQLVWVTYGSGNDMPVTMDSFEKIDADTYALHYSVFIQGEETPYYQGTLYLKMLNGRFIIEAHTNNL